MDTFIRIRQKDILTKPEEWRNAKPGKFIELSNRAKNVYCVLSVIAYSSAGNAKGEVLRNGNTLGDGWFWVSHNILQRLTGDSQKTVQRAISELVKSNMIDYHASRAQGEKCYYKIQAFSYNVRDDNPDQPKSPGEKVQRKRRPKGGYFLRLKDKHLSQDDHFLLWKSNSIYREMLTPEEHEKSYYLERKVPDGGLLPTREDVKPEVLAQLDRELEEFRKNKKSQTSPPDQDNTQKRVRDDWDEDDIPF